MTPPSAAASSALRTWLNRYAFALACAVAGIIALSLIYQDKNLTREELLAAIGLNLLASIVFAVVFVLLSERVRERNLRDSLSDQFAVLSAGLRADLMSTATTYLPSKVYQPTSTFADSFNRDVTESLAATRLYAFRGTSAKYVPARIKLCRQHPQQVRVVTLDPSSERALRRRAGDRNIQESLRNRPIADLISDIRDEIYMSLVALFDVRDACPIEILLVDEPLITRIEMFDDSVFVSWYHGPNSSALPFPETLRFPVGSFIYEVERLGIFRKFELAPTNARRFDATQTDADLCAYLTHLSGSTVTQAQLLDWRRRYQVFIRPFEQRLQPL